MNENEEFEFRLRMEQEQSAPQKPRFDAIEEPTWVDRAALGADKVLTSVGSVMPDFLPSRQNIVDLAAGASEMGGALRNAPRMQNVATDSGWRTAGRILDPVAAVAGIKGFQAAQQLPKIGAALQSAAPITSSIRPMLDKATSAMTATPFRQSIVGGAGAGAAIGTLQGEPLEGAAMGAAMGAAFRPLELLGSKAFELAANIKSGAEGQVVRYLDNMFQGDKAAVTTTLQQLKGLVAGERPTSGLAAVSGSTKIPALKALEEQARSRNPQLFIGADDANAAARIAPLDEMASPAQRVFNRDTGVVESQAEMMRKQMTGPLFARASNQQIAIPPQLAASLEGAQVSPLASRGVRGAEQSAANFGSAPVRGSAYVPEGPSNLGMMPDTPFMPQHETRSIAELQKVKDELGKRISDLAKATDNPSVSLRNNLIQARQNLMGQMTGQSGDYAVANTIFRNMSAPQNQGEIAAVLRDSLRSPSGAERQAAFLAATKKAPQTIRKAGGDPRFQSFEEVMTPDQIKSINQIGKSVQREADYKALDASTASLPEMRSTFSVLEDATPAFLRMAVAAIRKGLSVKGKATTNEAQQLLDRAAADPQFMMKLLNSELPKDRSKMANAIAARIQETRGLGTAQIQNVNQ